MRFLPFFFGSLITLILLVSAGCAPASSDTDVLEDTDRTNEDTDTHTDTDDCFVPGVAPGHPCMDLCPDVAAVMSCTEGCSRAEATLAYNEGRLACIHGNEPPRPETFDPANQGEGPDYQYGYDTCFFDQVRQGYEAEGCVW